MLILLPLSSFLFVHITKYWVSIREIKKETLRIDNEITSLKKEEKNLTGNVEKLQDPEYIARYLRERFLYSKDGEYIIRIQDEPKEA